MTIVDTLDTVSEWLKDNVCAKVSLKPHSFDDQTAAYDKKLVHPSVFALYVPTSKTKPPDVVATSPSICVQITDGTDGAFDRTRTIKLRLSFSAWDPGIHSQDVFFPTEGNPGHYHQEDPGQKGKLTPTHTGWRDVWNFVDTALRVIETSRTCGGYPLDPSTPVRFGAYDEAGDIADYYPFWFAWIELAITQEIIVAEPSIDDLL